MHLFSDNHEEGIIAHMVAIAGNKKWHLGKNGKLRENVW